MGEAELGSEANVPGAGLDVSVAENIKIIKRWWISYFQALLFCIMYSGGSSWLLLSGTLTGEGNIQCYVPISLK